MKFVLFAEIAEAALVTYFSLQAKHYPFYYPSIPLSQYYGKPESCTYLITCLYLAFKKLTEWKPAETRGRGKPKERWKGSVENDFGVKGVRHWWRVVEDRKR